MRWHFIGAHNPLPPLRMIFMNEVWSRTIYNNNLSNQKKKLEFYLQYKWSRRKIDKKLIDWLVNHFFDITHVLSWRSQFLHDYSIGQKIKVVHIYMLDIFRWDFIKKKLQVGNYRVFHKKIVFFQNFISRARAEKINFLKN